jgi:hypothetical protein
VAHPLNSAPASFAVFFFLVIASIGESLLRRYRGRILAQKDWDAKPASR